MMIFLSVTESYCPDNWIQFQQSCYYFSDGDTLSWQDAQNVCLEGDGDLVIINSEEENVRYISVTKNTTKHSKVLNNANLIE